MSISAQASRNLLKVFKKLLTETTEPVIVNITTPCDDRWIVVYYRENTMRCAIMRKDGSQTIVCSSDMIVK